MTLPFLSRESLAAWCVVPYDSERRDAAARARVPGERGIGRLVWDWRDEHVPLFDAELDALEDAGIELAGLWAPAPQGDDAGVVDVIAGLTTRAVERGHAPQLWSCPDTRKMFRILFRHCITCPRMSPGRRPDPSPTPCPDTNVKSP